MQIAMLAAGFSAGEADQLRRAMAAWKRKGGLEKFHGRLMEGMLARGYTAEFAESIYSQIQGLAEYGFPESHAASFALLAYASAWLKCHHRLLFWRPCSIVSRWVFIRLRNWFRTRSDTALKCAQSISALVTGRQCLKKARQRNQPSGWV